MKRILFLFLVLVLVVVPVFGQDAKALPEPTDVVADGCTVGITDSTPRIAIVSAFYRELQLHIQKATIEKVYTIGGRSFYVGQLENHPVVMFLSGGSMVNPAITMQDACYNFHLSGVFFSGIAGAMDNKVGIGDVVIPSQWKEYWHSLIARENTDGTYQVPDWFPGDPAVHFDFVYPMPNSITTVDGTPDKETTMPWYPADASYVEVAKSAVSNLTLLDCTPANVCLQHKPQVIVGGNGVSGDTYMDNAEVREWVNKTTDALVLDMESASVAHWAATRNMPVLIFRSASDLAGGGAEANEIGIFFELAADNGAAVLQAVLAAVPQP